jgi:GT2 family glycosyltransferase
MDALPQVTICVPVWNGARFVAQTLDSITRQTYPNVRVLISDDASTDGSAELCKGIAEQLGFELVVQSERRGWVGNCNFLLERARGDFVCILPHDDLLDECYVEVLAAHLSETPACAQVFCDVQAFEATDRVLTQPSLVGSPFERVHQLMTRHFDGTAFRGLVRRAAVDRAGGLPANAFDGFAADIGWLARLALEGEIHRVPEILYRKRYHSKSTAYPWGFWAEDAKIAAWADHCGDLFGVALGLDLSPAERWLITHAAVSRLIMANEQRGPYPRIRRLPIARKAEMVEALLARSEPCFFAEGTSVEERRRVAARMVEALAARRPVVAPRTPANILRFLLRKPLKLRSDK